MAGFLFALLASVVVGIGARDQALVAGLAKRQGARSVVLVLALLCASASAGAATWAGVKAAPLLVPAGKAMLVALVLAAAGIELLLVRPLRDPAEPTESLFAFGAVLLAQQLTDAARLVIFALAAASTLPAATALGGAIGCSLTIAAGWLFPAELRQWPLGAVRRGLGVALLAIAAWLAF
ncbi:MAG: hypothetical protein U1E37_07135 [Sphingomonadaceae bacterium]